MTFQDIRFALEANGIEKVDIEMLIDYCRKNGTDYEKLDEILAQKGYGTVFTDEFFGWADTDDEDFDEEYFSIEKIHHKHEWNE